MLGLNSGDSERTFLSLFRSPIIAGPWRRWCGRSCPRRHWCWQSWERWKQHIYLRILKRIAPKTAWEKGYSVKRGSQWEHCIKTVEVSLFSSQDNSYLAMRRADKFGFPYLLSLVEINKRNSFKTPDQSASPLSCKIINEIAYLRIRSTSGALLRHDNCKSVKRDSQP